MLALALCIFSTSSFSSVHFAFKVSRSTERFAISVLSCFSFSSSFSRLMASRSISSWRIWRLSLSSSSGSEFISRRSLAALSSIRSMALSGKNLSVIYRLDSSTAAIIASSLIRTWWCVSYLSFRPLKMEMASSTEGSSIITF